MEGGQMGRMVVVVDRTGKMFVKGEDGVDGRRDAEGCRPTPCWLSVEKLAECARSEADLVVWTDFPPEGEFPEETLWAWHASDFGRGGQRGGRPFNHVESDPVWKQLAALRDSFHAKEREKAARALRLLTLLLVRPTDTVLQKAIILLTSIESGALSGDEERPQPAYFQGKWDAFEEEMGVLPLSEVVIKDRWERCHAVWSGEKERLAGDEWIPALSELRDSLLGSEGGRWGLVDGMREWEEDQRKALAGEDDSDADRR
jgi:hypothetical protein